MKKFSLNLLTNDAVHVIGDSTTGKSHNPCFSLTVLILFKDVHMYVAWRMIDVLA